MNVPFGDLSRQYAALKSEIDEAVSRVLARGWFILGKELEAFEQELASYLGCAYTVGVASGTEAIQLALTAAGVNPGDEVITVANTCVPTVTGISSARATPVLVDVNPVTGTLDPDLLEQALTPDTRAIMPVHLYGQCVEMDRVLEIGSRNGVPVIEDAAQAIGATWRSKKAGTLGLAGCFSFYPSKNLGAYGDGGAVATNDSEFCARLKRLRNYGEERRYHHTIIGMNSRLDEIQAAILRVKLRSLESANARRRSIAKAYNQLLNNEQILKPVESSPGTHNYHLYVIRCERRDELQRWLADHGIGTLIHYPVPIHHQESYSGLKVSNKGFPVSERLCREVLSLPIFPELRDDEVQYVVECVNSFA